MEGLSRHDIYGHTKNYTQMTDMVYGKKSWKKQGRPLCTVPNSK